MDKAKTIGQKWLTNELDLDFLTLKKCTKGQSNRFRKSIPKNPNPIFNSNESDSIRTWIDLNRINSNESVSD